MESSEAELHEHEQHAARVLMVGLPGPELDPGTATRLAALRPGGAILFARNLDSPEQTATLLRELHGLLSPAPLLALDQEGGRVSRLEDWIGATPSACELAAAGESACLQFGRATGRLLHALGFNLDFAPVVDVCSEATANGIGDRSFGTDPERVALLAGAFLDGLREAGVAGCLKHFPGLGATDVDSHLELPSARRTLRELEQIELVPFERLSSRVPAVMVGHATYPALDPATDLPATLSRAIVTGLLRTRIGFDGLVATDDLEMGAVAPLDADGELAVRAIDAGCDLALYCADLARAERAHARIVRRATRDLAFAGRLRDAASNVERTARLWPATPPDLAAFASARSGLQSD